MFTRLNHQSEERLAQVDNAGAVEKFFNLCLPAKNEYGVFMLMSKAANSDSPLRRELMPALKVREMDEHQKQAIIESASVFYDRLRTAGLRPPMHLRCSSVLQYPTTPAYDIDEVDTDFRDWRRLSEKLVHHYPRTTWLITQSMDDSDQEKRKYHLYDLSSRLPQRKYQDARAKLQTILGTDVLLDQQARKYLRMPGACKMDHSSFFHVPVAVVDPQREEPYVAIPHDTFDQREQLAKDGFLLVIAAFLRCSFLFQEGQSWSINLTVQGPQLPIWEQLRLDRPTLRHLPPPPHLQVDQTFPEELFPYRRQKVLDSFSNSAVYDIRPPPLTAPESIPINYDCGQLHWTALPPTGLDAATLQQCQEICSNYHIPDKERLNALLDILYPRVAAFLVPGDVRFIHLHPHMGNGSVRTMYLVSETFPLRAGRHPMQFLRQPVDDAATPQPMTAQQLQTVLLPHLRMFDDRMFTMDNRNNIISTFEGRRCHPSDIQRFYGSPIAKVMEYIMKEGVCGGDVDQFKWLRALLAEKLYNPDYMPQVCPVLLGEPFAGKSLLAKMYAALWGSHGVVLEVEHAISRDGFNATMHKKLFVGLDELSSLQKREYALLKYYISSLDMEYNEKKERKEVDKNRALVMLMGNPQNLTSSFHLDMLDRRFKFFNGKAIGAYLKWVYTLLEDEPFLAAVTGYLLSHRDPAFNPSQFKQSYHFDALRINSCPLHKLLFALFKDGVIPSQPTVLNPKELMNYIKILSEEQNLVHLFNITSLPRQFPMKLVYQRLKPMIQLEGKATVHNYLLTTFPALYLRKEWLQQMAQEVVDHLKEETARCEDSGSNIVLFSREERYRFGPIVWRLMAETIPETLPLSQAQQLQQRLTREINNLTARDDHHEFRACDMVIYDRYMDVVDPPDEEEEQERREEEQEERYIPPTPPRNATLNVDITAHEVLPPYEPEDFEVEEDPISPPPFNTDEDEQDEVVESSILVRNSPVQAPKRTRGNQFIDIEAEVTEEEEDEEEEGSDTNSIGDFIVEDHHSDGEHTDGGSSTVGGSTHAQREDTGPTPPRTPRHSQPSRATPGRLRRRVVVESDEDESEGEDLPRGRALPPTPEPTTELLSALQNNGVVLDLLPRLHSPPDFNRPRCLTLTQLNSPIDDDESQPTDQISTTSRILYPRPPFVSDINSVVYSGPPSDILPQRPRSADDPTTWGLSPYRTHIGPTL